MPTVKDSCERDFFEWTRETAEKIRQGSFSSIDLETLAEEVEDLGRRDRREVRSRIVQIILHLLNWEYQPEYRQNLGEHSWRTSIRNQRRELASIFEDSPSLRRFRPDSVADLYPRALEEASDETGLPLSAFPEVCPWTIDQILDPKFFPEA